MTSPLALLLISDKTMTVPPTPRPLSFLLQESALVYISVSLLTRKVRHTWTLAEEGVLASKQKRPTCTEAEPL